MSVPARGFTAASQASSTVWIIGYLPSRTMPRRPSGKPGHAFHSSPGMPYTPFSSVVLGCRPLLRSVWVLKKLPRFDGRLHPSGQPRQLSGSHESMQRPRERTAYGSDLAHGFPAYLAKNIDRREPARLVMAVRVFAPESRLKNQLKSAWRACMSGAILAICVDERVRCQSSL